METFIKKYIKSEDDLPKEADAYFVGKKYDTGFVKTTVLDAENYNPLDNNWLKEVNYYIDSCPELVELIKAQQELIDFYGKTISDNSAFLATHHITASDDDIVKGNEIRTRIETLNKEIGL